MHTLIVPDLYFKLLNCCYTITFFNSASYAFFDGILKRPNVTLHLLDYS